MVIKRLIMLRKTMTVLAVLCLCGICAVNTYAQKTVSVRVLSMNIKEGGKFASYRTAPFAEIIREYNPDVVALQEVHQNTLYNGNKDWTALLAEETGMFPYFCRSFDYAGGGFGVAVLSKYPFFKSEYIVSVMEGAREPRATGWVYMAMPDGNVLRLGSVHLAVENECIISNMADLNKKFFANDTETPALLIGDYNSLPDSDQHIYFKRKWQDVGKEIGPTIPSEKPNKKLDYIMGYPKGKWEMVHYEVIARPDMSDHCFIVADVRLNIE